MNGGCPAGNVGGCSLTSMPAPAACSWPPSPAAPPASACSSASTAPDPGRLLQEAPRPGRGDLRRPDGQDPDRHLTRVTAPRPIPDRSGIRSRACTSTATPSGEGSARTGWPTSRPTPPPRPTATRRPTAGWSPPPPSRSPTPPSATAWAGRPAPRAPPGAHLPLRVDLLDAAGRGPPPARPQPGGARRGRPHQGRHVLQRPVRRLAAGVHRPRVVRAARARRAVGRATASSASCSSTRSTCRRSPTSRSSPGCGDRCNGISPTLAAARHREPQAASGATCSPTCASTPAPSRATPTPTPGSHDVRGELKRAGFGPEDHRRPDGQPAASRRAPRVEGRRVDLVDLRRARPLHRRTTSRRRRRSSRRATAVARRADGARPRRQRRPLLPRGRRRRRVPGRRRRRRPPRRRPPLPRSSGPRASGGSSPSCSTSPTRPPPSAGGPASDRRSSSGCGPTSCSAWPSSTTSRCPTRCRSTRSWRSSTTSGRRSWSRCPTATTRWPPACWPASGPGVFDHYDRPQWEAALGRRFDVVEQVTLPSGTRTLYLCRPR